jgi:transcriptional regulator with XRE-family HTH domain
MESPFTGKPMPEKKEKRTISFRKEDFEVIFHFFLCEETGEKFEDETFANLNFNQAVNQYREKFAIPFPEQIVSIREKYGVSAAAMSEILGFGINIYRQYESGEVPNQSNARLIQLAEDPHEFRKLLDLCSTIEARKKEKIFHRIEAILSQQKNQKAVREIEQYFLGPEIPSCFSGYRKPNLQRLTEMVVFFTEKLQPYKTKLNKLLFYADFGMFQKSFFSISGAQYVALPMGPVPDKFNGVFEYMVNSGIIDVKYFEFADGGIGEQFFSSPNHPFKPELFLPEELNMLEKTAERFRDISTGEIIALSHKEKAWAENQKGKGLIDYRLGLEMQRV